MAHHVRLAAATDRDAVLALYRQLSPDDPQLTSHQADEAWRAILGTPNTYVLLAEADGGLVSTCTLTIVPNLTRGARPYALIENVVTDANYRRLGYGTAVLTHALDLAWGKGAYKVMLATGSTRESTLQFYERAGFTRGGKTFFQARRD